MAGFHCTSEQNTQYPGYQRFFSRAAGIFGVGRRPTHLRHYKDLTETGNRARKVSGTQGKCTDVSKTIIIRPVPLWLIAPAINVSLQYKN